MDSSSGQTPPGDSSAGAAASPGARGSRDANASGDGLVPTPIRSAVAKRAVLSRLLSAGSVRQPSCDDSNGNGNGSDSSGNGSTSIPAAVPGSSAATTVFVAPTPHAIHKTDKDKAQVEESFWRTVSSLLLPVITWLAAATTFYHLWNGWSVPEAFYYAVQGGLSIGFGVLAEGDDVSRAFTTVHVLLGALGITVMVSLLVETALANLDASVRVSLAASRLVGDKDDDGNGDKDVAKFNDADNASLASRLLEGVLTTEVAVAVAWVCLGAAAGYATQGFTAVQSFYFAVTAVSTGGLEGVHRDGKSLLACGVFCLVGVPTFSIATSKLAAIWLEHRAVNRIRDQVGRERMEMEQFMNAAHSLDRVSEEKTAVEGEGGTTTGAGADVAVVDLAEYLCMELETLGLVRREHLAVLVDRFMEMDTNNDGTISVAEARRAGLLSDPVPPTRRSKDKDV